MRNGKIAVRLNFDSVLALVSMHFLTYESIAWQQALGEMDESLLAGGVAELLPIHVTTHSCTFNV